DIVRKIRYMKPSLTFRDKFQYNNFMFVTAGYLIEAITGKKWEDFLAERIFGPLGIGEYGFLHPDPLQADKYARLYVPDEEGINKETAPLRFEGMGPAGSILTPIGEAAKWLQFNLNGGKVGEEALIPPEIFVELYKPNIPYQLLPFQTPGNIEVGYALGWFVDSYHGNKKVEHGGNVDGGTANVAFLPDKGIGCVVLTNADSSTFPMAFTADLFDRFLGVKRDVNIYEHYHTEFKKVIEETMGALRAILDTKVEGKPCSHELDDYVGTYSHEAYGDTEVFIKDGELKAQLHGNFLDLEHLHYDTFTFEIFKMLTPMTFQTAVDGSIKSFETPLEQTVDPIVFTKAAAPEEKKEA
ncbi:MAG: serine hydrolase, partial [Clostridiales Family XIII bacterium]|nr:serine hydrolase [Clostridiales Family XIII bacterium]